MAFKTHLLWASKVEEARLDIKVIELGVLLRLDYNMQHMPVWVARAAWKDGVALGVSLSWGSDIQYTGGNISVAQLPCRIQTNMIGEPPELYSDVYWLGGYYSADSSGIWCGFCVHIEDDMYTLQLIQKESAGDRYGE